MTSQHPILEGIVTTTNPDGTMHLAPMGPRVDPAWTHFLLRPFPTSHTFQNLKSHREGVLHVTDDVGLLARAAVGKAGSPTVRPAERVRGFVLAEACRFYEFRVQSLDESGERVHLECEVVHHGTIREFFGFNRAKHAVLEAAIVVTRLHLLPESEVTADFEKWRIIINKCGSNVELDAFAFLSDVVDQYRATRRGT